MLTRRCGGRWKYTGRQVQSPNTVRAYTLAALAHAETETDRLDAAIGHLEEVLEIRPLDGDPWGHAAGAIALARALVKKGHDRRPRACRLAAQAMVGFKKPVAFYAQAKMIADTRRFLARNRCAASKS